MTIEPRTVGAALSDAQDRASQTGPSAITIAEQVDAGVISAEEIVAAQLARIDEADPGLNALIRVDDDDAVRQARDLDRHYSSGALRQAQDTDRQAQGTDRQAQGTDRQAQGTGRPLPGVPFVIKDNLDVGGQLTSAGSLAPDRVAPDDAEVVRRLRAAGAILVGRANMDELAMGASGENSAFGATYNPWDLRRSAGGSSGGSAAAVAAGLAPLAVGTDTGGSIREPASQCGVVGMRPSPGWVPRDGLIPFAPELDRIGPMAASAADAARMLAVMADRPEITTASLPHRPRLGLVRELSGPPNQPGVLARLRAIADLATDLGWDVIEVSVPEASDALAAYMPISSAASTPHLEPFVRTGRAGAEVVRRWEHGRTLLITGDDALGTARALQQRLTEAVEAALSRCDALLSPTMPTTAPVLPGRSGPDPAADPPYADCWTVLAALTGLAAISVPAGCSADDGMPVGVQLAAGPGSDATLLALARALTEP